MGIPEMDIESPLGNSEFDRIEYVIEKTGISLNRGDYRMRRLGQNTSQIRPILLTLDCHEVAREY